jgi:hypothetical protein
MPSGQGKPKLNPITKPNQVVTNPPNVIKPSFTEPKPHPNRSDPTVNEGILSGKLLFCYIILSARKQNNLSPETSKNYFNKAVLSGGLKCLKLLVCPSGFLTPDICERGGWTFPPLPATALLARAASSSPSRRLFMSTSCCLSRIGLNIFST